MMKTLIACVGIIFVHQAIARCRDGSFGRPCVFDIPCPLGYSCTRDNTCCRDPDPCPLGPTGPLCSTAYPCNQGYECQGHRCCQVCPAGMQVGGLCSNTPGQARCRRLYTCMNDICCAPKRVCHSQALRCPSVISARCLTDNDCPRGQLCCRNPCGGSYYCTVGVPVSKLVQRDVQQTSIDWTSDDQFDDDK